MQTRRQEDKWLQAPHGSLPTVTPGASAYMPDPGPEPGWRRPPYLPIYRMFTRSEGRQALEVGLLGEGFLWFLLQAEVAASSGGSVG